MSDLEDALVDKIISRIVSELPFYKQTKRLQKASLSKQNEASLVDISASKTDTVVNKLLMEMEKLSAMQTSSEDNAIRMAKSQLRLLELTQRCLSCPWDHIKSQYKSLNESELSEEDLHRLKEKSEKALPPPISQEICKRLYKSLVVILTSKSTMFLQAELQEKATKCLFQLSASNYDDIVSQILPLISSTSSEEEVTTHGVLLEYLNVNEYNLGRVLTSLAGIVSGTKKTNVQVVYAKVIHQVIWNWINRYPLEFQNLCKTKRKVHSKAEELFDLFDGWASNSTKKGHFWPTCTMLMVLCPDVMLEVVIKKSGGSKNSNKKKFFESLEKGLGTSKLSDVATVCYVDICKASTYNSKDPESALKFLFTNTETELIGRLFNAQAAMKSEASFNEGLMTDFLLSSFYLSPRKVVNSLFAQCVKPDSPPLFKRVLVNTLYLIASGEPLPWNPTISDVYSAHASNLRQMFQDLIPKMKEFNALKNSSDKKGKAQFEKVAADISILNKLIALYRADPILALFQKGTSDFEEIKAVLSGLCSCVAEFGLPELSTGARKALMSLHQPEHIKQWCPDSGIEGFWLISSCVIISLGKLIRDNKNLRPEHIEGVINLLEYILEQRILFFEQTSHIEPSPKSKSERFLASSVLESTLLVFLGSKNNEVVSKCINSLRCICKEIELLRHTLNENDNSLISNYEAYKQLSDGGNLFTGRQAQQKTIQTNLKAVQVQTVGNFVAWDELYARWQKTTEIVISNEEAAAAMSSGAARSDRRGKKPTEQYDAKRAAETLTEWTNCLGILCSMSAVLLNQTSANKGDKTKSLSSLSEPDDFLAKLMNYLTSDFVSIREKVKRMLGVALSPEVYPTFFRILHNHSKEKLFKSKSSDQVNFTNETILFVDQAISIIKIILEEGHEELSLIADFEEIILVLLKFVRQTTVSAKNLQIRHKLCSLLEAVMERSTSLSFNNENQFRTDLIENIMEWTSEFSTKDSNLPSDLSDGDNRQLKKIIKELDAQVMKSIAALLQGLTLHGKDDEAKSNLFSKFFTFFTRLLTRCKKNPSTVLTPQLPEATIQSLSYLVTANIEHGLEYFVTMGYHRDHETRSAFLKVLTNILKERSDFDSGEAADKYYKLEELVMEGDLDVLLTLCDITPITEADIVAQLLVRFFESHEKTLDLLKAAIMQEVRKTETANTLFRRNSMATKLLAAYCKLIGRDYLRIALGPHLKQIMQSPPTCELDPSKLPANEDLHVNQKNVLQMSERFLKDISASIPYCPGSFRIICKFLGDVVKEKFPGSEDTAIAGFMFLRYLCPAIVAPDGYGVIDSAIADKNFRRCLVLVTKVLQNLANRVQFTKEPFMHCMNPFIEDNLPVIRDMFLVYTKVSEDDPMPPPISFSDEQKAQDMGRIHYYLATSKEKLAKEWASAQDSPLDRLTSILSQLGPPPELPTTTKTVQVRQAAIGSDKKNLHFEKFMNRMANKNTDEIKAKEIFYQQGKTTKGIPVFYYIARNYTPGNDDLLIYYMLQTSRNFLTKAYSLVIDLTLFAPQHQMSGGVLSSFSKVIPVVASANIDSVYFINTNQWFKKYSKNLAKFVPRVSKKFVFCADVSQLFSYIAKDQCKLPTDTLSMANTVQATFSPVTKTTQSNKKEVKLIICTDVVQIVSLKPQPVLGHQAIMNDILHVSSIVDIHKETNFNSVTLRYQMGDSQRSVEMGSDAKDQIAQQLTSFRDRYKLSQPQASLARSKAFRPSDVPGTLLNMALMNLTVSNHALRAAAYNLLVALCNTFAFKIDSSLLEASEAAVPQNSKSFTVRVSSELAQMEPAMTLEFLQQSLDGMSNADKVSQVLVLDYVKPWLWNFGSFYLGDSPDEEKNEAKIIEIYEKLINFSVNAGVIRPAVLTKVWSILGCCPRMLDHIISQLLAAYHQANVNDVVSDSLDDIIASVAAVNASLVAGKIITRLLARLDETNEGGTVDRIEKHSSWKELEVMLRWLVILSFDNLLCVETYLPELLHVILMSFFTGDSLIRSSIYGLFVNIIHALFSSEVCHEEKQQMLRMKFNQFQELPTRLQFGIGGNASYAPFQPPSARDGKLDNVSLANVENVAGFLFQVLNSCSVDTSCIGTHQHARWLSLVSRTAFTPNPLLQPRAIIALGVLAQSPNLITDELIGNLLKLLREALAACESAKKIDDLTLSIISCLSRLFLHIRADSKYYQSFFWIAMSLLQIHDTKLFASCVYFLDQIVHSMSDNGCFRGQGLAACCVAARKGPSERMLAKLDQLSGIGFKYDFSFAVAGHLLKGLKNVGTKAAVSRLLNTFVEYSHESNPANVTGYFAAILPHCGDNLSESCRQRLLSCSETGSSIFNARMVPDKIRASLLFMYLVTILKSSESEHEQLYIYKALEEGAHFMPDCLPVTFDVLMKKMEQVLVASQNDQMLTAVLAIMNSVYTYGLESNSPITTLNKQYMDSIGFSSLGISDQFNQNQKGALIPAVCSVLDGFLQL